MQKPTPWWRRKEIGIWNCEVGIYEAEVEEVTPNRYVWTITDDRGREFSGTATRCTDAMRAAECQMWLY